jgi:hypothetical protein
MDNYLDIAVTDYGFHIETGLVDLYITPKGILLIALIVVALRVRKVIKTRKAGK